MWGKISLMPFKAFPLQYECQRHALCICGLGLLWWKKMGEVLFLMLEPLLPQSNSIISTAVDTLANDATLANGFELLWILLKEFVPLFDHTKHAPFHLWPDSNDIFKFDPSIQPSDCPSHDPSSNLSSVPSCDPSSNPSSWPSCDPSSNLLSQPLDHPSKDSQPSDHPSRDPSSNPSSVPSHDPSSNPSSQPVCDPSSNPSRVLIYCDLSTQPLWWP